jgi:hypothetical protein
MAKIHISSKHIMIDKANTTVVIAISIASFLTVFSLIASKALLSQRSYQARVITEKQKAKTQLDKNVKAADSLVVSYKAFAEQQTNLIGGSSTGSGPHDGDNAKLVLDALPSKYDFPALTSSLEKILLDNHFKIEGIGGTDDELTYNTTDQNASGAVEMPFSLTVEANYSSIQNLLKVLEQSIRPFEIRKVSFNGTDNSLRATINGVTYYQPEKKLEFKTKEVK